MTLTQFISRSLRYFVLVALIAIPSLQVWSWFLAPIPCPPGASLCTISSWLQLSPPVALNFGAHFLGWAINLIPTFIEVLTFYCLVQLLKLVEQRKFFTPVNVYYLRYMGITLILYDVTKIMATALMSFLVSFQDEIPKKFTISSGFSHHSFYVVGGGGVVLLVAWLVSKANRTQAEQPYFV